MNDLQNSQHEKKKRITPKEPVTVIIQHEFVSTQSLLEAFIPVIYEDIRRKLETGHTIDNGDNIA